MLEYLRTPSSHPLEYLTVIVDDMWTDPTTAYWLDNCKRFGVRSVAALPFSQGGDTVGVLCVYAEEVDFFEEPLIGLLQEIALAISFALESWERDEQRKQAERAMSLARQAQAKAEASDTAKTQFLTRMGHELRTPLNAILGFAQLLRERTGPQLDAKARKQLDLIFKAGAQLRLLLDDALDLNRMDTGELVFQPQAVDPCALVDDVVQLIQPLAEEAGVAVRHDCPSSLPSILVVDVDRLRQVLLNLLSNSVRYNTSGGWVGLSANASSGVLLLTVEDNGPTLSAEQLSRIFEPFQPTTEGSNLVNRSGLGMMLTRQLVEALGGRMTVESEEGRGTRIRVLLPKLEERRSRARTAEEEEQDLNFAALLSSGKVLYIEDNRINAVLVQEALEPWPDIEVVVAESGERGLELIRTVKPDLVLLDMLLPDISGVAVLERLRANPETAHQRVVVLSASAIPELRQRAQAAGVLDYWMKPIEFPPTVKGVRKYLAESSSA